MYNEDIIFLNQSLGSQMASWHTDGKKIGILLIDEEITEEKNKQFMDASQYHQNQANIIRLANNYNYPIFVTTMSPAFTSSGASDRSIAVEAKAGFSLPGPLDSEVPSTVQIYKKNMFDPYCESNPFFKTDIISSGVTSFIVMGQSRNACCANTSLYLKREIPSLEFYTSHLLVRFCRDTDCTTEEKWRTLFKSAQWSSGITVFTQL